MKEETKAGVSVGEEIQVLCATCKGERSHIVLASVDNSGGVDVGDNDHYYWSNSYQIVRCQGCKLIAFRKTHENSEDLEPDRDGEGWSAVVTTEVFPNPTAGRSPIQDEFYLPSELRGIYLETIACLNASHAIVTGIGIRAIVETVCNEKKAAGHDLASKINDLMKQGLLTKEGADILHKLRTLGNKSAHEVKPHSQKQLSLAMDVIDHLLVGVYVLPIHAQNTFK